MAKVVSEILMVYVSKNASIKPQLVPWPAGAARYWSSRGHTNIKNTKVLTGFQMVQHAVTLSAW